MSTTMFAALVALSPGQGVPYSPPAVLWPPPPLIQPGTEANFITRTPYGYIPNLYPIVPQPVVIAHPDWYPNPGPAYYYGNNVTPYHAVYHGVVHVVPGKPIEPKVVVPKVTDTPPPVVKEKDAKDKR